MCDVAESAVVALLATPYRPEGRVKRDKQKDSNRRFKAESTSLRHSDLQYILDAVRATQSLSAAHRSDIDAWAQKGIWTGDSLQTIGAVRLSKPRRLQDMGQCRSREHFVLWHAWGSPTAHATSPQWLLFDAVDAVAFSESLDHRPFVFHLRVAEQRTSWAVHLSAAAVADLGNVVCTDGRSFHSWLLDWGVQPTQAAYPIFTSLPPIVILVAHRRWHTLADIPRCTAQLLRRPRGTDQKNTDSGMFSKPSQGWRSEVFRA